MMTNVYRIPLFGLALGAMVAGASLAQAEGDVETQDQTQIESGVETGTEMDTGMDTGLDSDVDTGLDAQTKIDADIETGAESQILDTAVRIEIEDDAVTHQGLTVSEIEGMDVYTTGDESIGEVEDVLGDDTGEVKAFVIEISDGVFDLDPRKVVVPVDRLTLDAENDRFNTQLTQADIEAFELWAE
jgi:sporulation protein YlmC with PRC-barrel domain